MRSLVVALVALVLFQVSVNAQAPAASNPAATAVSDRTHNGFYFSFGLGPVFGNVKDEYTDTTGTYELLFKGTGLAIDFRIGGAIKPDLILTGDIISRAVVSPDIELDGKSVSTSDYKSLSEVTYGVGLTKYYMPLNLYAGVTLGTGVFVVENDATQRNTRSEFGFSGAIRAGKSWWIGQKWCLGLGTMVSYTSAKTDDDSYEEKLSATRFMLTAYVSFQ